MCIDCIIICCRSWVSPSRFHHFPLFYITRNLCGNGVCSRKKSTRIQRENSIFPFCYISKKGNVLFGLHELDFLVEHIVNALEESSSIHHPVNTATSDRIFGKQNLKLSTKQASKIENLQPKQKPKRNNNSDDGIRTRVSASFSRSPDQALDQGHPTTTPKPRGYNPSKEWGMMGDPDMIDRWTSALPLSYKGLLRTGAHSIWSRLQR